MDKSKKDETKKMKGGNIYMRNVLARELTIPFNSVGENIEEVIRNKLSQLYESKCIENGYIKKNSIRLLTFSHGTVDAENIKFNVAFECSICKPVEGMRIKCKAVQITKAGIRALYETKTEEPSPVNIFIAREHHLNNSNLNNVEENDLIDIKVIGIRYEINDSNIAVLGELKGIVEKVGKEKLKEI